MADDIVTRLRVIAWGANEGEEYAHVCRLAAEELVDLRRWKSEAIGVLEDWHAVFDLLFGNQASLSAEDLGRSKSDIVAREITRLRAVLGQIAAIHQPDEVPASMGGPFCTVCDTGRWPCKTHQLARADEAHRG